MFSHYYALWNLHKHILWSVTNFTGAKEFQVIFLSVDETPLIRSLFFNHFEYSKIGKVFAILCWLFKKFVSYPNLTLLERHKHFLILFRKVNGYSKSWFVQHLIFKAFFLKILWILMIKFSDNIYMTKSILPIINNCNEHTKLEVNWTWNSEKPCICKSIIRRHVHHNNANFINFQITPFKRKFTCSNKIAIDGALKVPLLIEFTQNFELNCVKVV